MEKKSRLENPQRSYLKLNVPWTFELVDSETLDEGDFVPKLRADDCIGASITIPHKVTCIEDCDDITDTGRAVGAVNTIYKVTDQDTGRTRIIGTNTDCIGVRESFLQGYPGILKESTGRPALVVGAGGACRSAIYALHEWLDASEVYLVNRLKEKADAVIESFAGVNKDLKITHLSSVKEAAGRDTPVLIIGTVPNISPTTGGEVRARDVVLEFIQRPQKGYVLEMCYRPIRTSFYRLCEGNGWEVTPGIQPLIYQAIAQEEAWMDRPLGEDLVRIVQASVAEELCRREKKHENGL